MPVYINYTLPLRQELKANLTTLNQYETQMKSLDEQIEKSAQQKLINKMEYYFTPDQILEITEDQIKYEIKVNGDKITASNINYNSKRNNITIEISAHMSTEIYPPELLAKICPIRICPEGKEQTDIISLHTTLAQYTFTPENSGSKHSYIYQIRDITPGEIITLKIHDLRISSKLTPQIRQLEVTYTK